MTICIIVYYIYIYISKIRSREHLQETPRYVIAEHLVSPVDFHYRFRVVNHMVFHPGKATLRALEEFVAAVPAYGRAMAAEGFFLVPTKSLRSIIVDGRKRLL